MIPSWTETLIAAGVDVVGRTRFCIHPKPEVSKIPAVGGTKDIKWDKVKELGADLLLLDQEENPKAMADESPLPYIVTHIKSVSDVERDCRMMADKFKNKKLEDIADRWKKISTHKPKPRTLEEIPGIMKWLKSPTIDDAKFIYLIWKNPWMAVSKQTFIGSVFERLGLAGHMIDFSTAYPEIKLEDYNPLKTLLLCSTEPFPFAKKQDDLSSLPNPSAIIDGEAYSWFGVRSLEFLEKNIR